MKSPQEGQLYRVVYNNLRTIPFIFNTLLHPYVSKEITLQQRNPWTNQKIRDLDISRHSIIVLVKRNKKIIIPSGNLTLLEGDTVVLYTQTYMANADDLEI